MQQQGGSQYGVPPPEMTPFMGIPGGPDHLQPPPQQPSPLSQLAEAASPISSRPPPPAGAGAGQRSHFEELVPGTGGNFPDDEALAAAGEEVERGGAPGNRWPRQETLALLKIRSEMDAAFRDATLKGPLWEDVSRKLAELGYKRSAKKCKEKFENVHKYYKRTRENRAGRQDGKTYRFFSQLEALHAATTTAPNPAAAVSPVSSIGVSAGMVGPSSARIQPTPISVVPPQSLGSTIPIAAAAATPTAGISFSSMSTSSESDDSDDEGTEEIGGSREQGKRKRRGGSGGSRKMMAFFEGLMKQVMERQEAMQQRFLETIEKREQERMIREEAWRRQEMARLSREQDILAQERAMASSRDAAVISFIQKISGQTIPLPTTLPTTTTTFASISPTQYPISTPPPAPPPQQQQTPPQHQQQKQHHHQQPQQTTAPPPPPQHIQQVQEFRGSEQHDQSGSAGMETMSASSRWPKPEVHALIKLRSGLETKYQEAGPKGPLWEEIAAGMQRMGYSRSAKRCKEKWENINKYFKKVKESNKKRPEDAKTCPYFHQLDALYRKKNHGGGGGASSSGVVSMGSIQQQGQETDHSNPNPQERGDFLTIMAAPQAPQQPESESNDNNNNDNLNNSKRNVGNPEEGGGSGAIQIQTSNGGLTPTLLEEGTSGGGMAMKKPEDIVKKLMEQQRQQAAMESYDKLDDPDSDVNMDQDDEEDEDEDEDEEDGKMQYKIEFQRPNVSGGGGNAPTTAAATTTGSFLAMV
ncbi:trihelix transcription factor GTL1-like isoform X1 [Typha angustifolia]|uniref:trihelix transcription factor GTL1-like isoform X1 n=1 Tax=Typha angustifolia TaxID=59011 RepID=UPI003C2F76F9